MPVDCAETTPPDSLTNLKVFPKDIEVRALISQIRGFALDLGVRCEFWHVGEPNQPLSEFDFAADEKETKLKAREMLRMVGHINEEHLPEVPNRSDPPIEVTCETCPPRDLEAENCSSIQRTRTPSKCWSASGARRRIAGSF